MFGADLALVLALGVVVGAMGALWAGRWQRSRLDVRDWRTLFDSSPIPMYAYNLDTELLVAVNETLCERYGYRVEELVGGPLARLHIESQQAELHDVVVALRGSYDAHFRRRWIQRKRSGEEIPVEISSRPLRQNGARVRVVAAIDISEKLQAEQALASQQRFQESLLEILPVPVFHKDRQGRYLGVNAAFVGLMGRPRETFVGKTVWEIAPPATAQVYHDADEALYAHPETVQVYDAHVLSQDAGLRDVVFTKAVFHDHSGALGGLVGVVMDVTAQRASQQALRESESRLAQILRNSPLPVFVIDAQHRLVVWNPACEYTFGVPASAMLGTTRHWSAFYPSERPCMADILLDGGTQTEIDHYYHGLYRPSTLNPDAFEAEDFFPAIGSQGRWLYFTASPLRDGTGKVVGAIETLMDISALKRAQQEVQQFNVELEAKVAERTAELAQANENLRQATQQLVQTEKLAALGSVVAGVAHELNTPVGIVLTAVTTLQHQAQAFQAELASGSAVRRANLNAYIAASLHACELIERSAVRADQLIRNFKELAVDPTHARRRKFDMRAVVEEIVATLQSPLQQAVVDMQIEIASAIALDSYPGALGQILTHLVMNSLQHGFEGRVRGRITLRAHVQDTMVVLCYEDDGVGMGAQAAHRAFDPFYTTKLGQGGSGLGLYVVYNLATGVLGGSVALRTDLGAGVRFELVLPLVAPAAQDNQRNGNGLL